MWPVFRGGNDPSIDSEMTHDKIRGQKVGIRNVNVQENMNKISKP